MRKKLVATLLAGAVAATSLIGFTACNNDGADDGDVMQKGEQVTEAQWKTSIAATAAAENYTLTVNYEDKTSGAKQDDETVKYTYTESMLNKGYFDLNAKKLFA